MNAKWKPAANAIACRWSEMLVGGLLGSLPAVSLSFLGIAVNRPPFKLFVFEPSKFPVAWINFAAGSKSGLVMLRYRVQKLVSMVNWVRFVRRPPSPRKFWFAPVALLVGRCRNGSRLTALAPFDSR